jgi:protein-L-isoaspartate(D-aspartate) O-methyltransferase
MSKIINDLIKDGYLKNDLVIDAMEHIDRVEFVPEEMELLVNADVALPIGYGQSIPKPLVVAFMLELLDPQKGQKILDIGSGSGWTTALLARIVGEKGKVISLERIKSLCDFAEKNTDKYDFVKKGIVEFHSVDIAEGLSGEAPYDRIMVAPSVLDEASQTLKNQLKIGGKMVIPIGNSVVYLERENETDFSREEFPGFDFVPFILNP